MKIMEELQKNIEFLDTESNKIDNAYKHILVQFVLDRLNEAGENDYYNQNGTSIIGSEEVYDDNGNLREVYDKNGTPTYFDISKFEFEDEDYALEFEVLITETTRMMMYYMKNDTPTLFQTREISYSIHGIKQSLEYLAPNAKPTKAQLHSVSHYLKHYIHCLRQVKQFANNEIKRLQLTIELADKLIEICKKYR